MSKDSNQQTLELSHNQKLANIEEAIGSISKGLEQIINDFPEAIDQDEVQDYSQVIEMLNSPRLRVAQAIRQSYLNGNLSMVDQVTAAAKNVSMLSYSNVFNANNFINGSNDDDGGSRKGWPPPLPPIYNDKLREKVFTHKSIANKRYYRSETELLHDHNERLEFLGDAILNYTMSEVVYRRFPDLPEGDLTAIRSSLVKNETLWEWATIYGLDKQLKTEFDVFPDADGKKSKLISDVMEAYIGGVCQDTDSGRTIIHSWLLELVEPYVQTAVEERAKIKPLNKEAKNDLYVKIGSMDMRPEYITVVEGDNLHPFTVECRILGETIGSGTGTNTKEAGLRAAMKALDNEEIIEKYAEIRRQTPRSAGDFYDNINNTGSKQNPANAPPYKRQKKNNHPASDNNNLETIRKNVSKNKVNSKDALYSLIGSSANRPNYISNHANGKYYTTVYMRDDKLGEGVASTKKVSEQYAATDALQQDSILKKWSVMKN